MCNSPENADVVLFATLTWSSSKVHRAKLLILAVQTVKLVKFKFCLMTLAMIMSLTKSVYLVAEWTRHRSFSPPKTF